MKNFKLVIIFFLMTACQSAQDAFSLKKDNNMDEFLVEKKSPLVMPPDFGKLPYPDEKKSNMQNEKIEDSDEVKKILNNKKPEVSTTQVKNDSKSAIENILLENLE